MPKTEIEHLARIEALLTVLTKRALSQTIREELADKTLRRVYELTGTGTVKHLATRTGLSTGKISGLWKKWEEAGLIVKDGVQYKKVT